MRNYIRQLILFIIGLLLIVGIYIVDVIFYRVPNFIKVFRIEREIATIVAVLLIFPMVRALYNRYIKSIKAHGILFLSLVFSLFGFLFLPQLFLKKYIVLWDNNPMLAEYPLVWNVYSIICATIFALVLMLKFHIIKNMVITGTNHLVKAGYNILFLSILVGAGLLNFLEDRYLYQPVLDGYIGLFNEYKIGIISFMGLSAGISINGNWQDELNKKAKIFYTFGGMILVILLVLLFSSKHIVAVYSFGTTIKGFILIGFIFILVFFCISVLKLLVHLPTAAKLDRASLELEYISKIEMALRNNLNSQKDIIKLILEMTKELTNANGCWLEVQKDNKQFEIIEAINIEQQLIDDIGFFTMDELRVKLVDQGEDCIVNNVPTHPMTKHFKLLKCDWKSMIALPLIEDDDVKGVLYIVKKRSNGFLENDVKTLNRFLSYLEKSINQKETKYQEKESILKLELDGYQAYIGHSDRFQYDYIESNHVYRYCIYGIGKSVSSEMKAEIRGSLRILMKLNNDIQKIVESVREIFITNDSKPDFLFYFVDMNENKIHIAQYDKINYITSNQNEICSNADSSVYVNFDDWGMFWLDDSYIGMKNKMDIFKGIGQLPSNIHKTVENIQDCFFIKSINLNN